MKMRTAYSETKCLRFSQRGRAGLALLLGVLCWQAAGAVAKPVQGQASVSIMTQNMDSGTDLGYVVVLGAPAGVDLTLAEIQAALIPERAALLAHQIAQQKPDIVGLQEVTLWRTGVTPETTTNVLYDQLELLLTALASEGASYEVVAVNLLTDVALPGSTGAARYTDRDVLLVRSGLRPPALHFSDVHARLYQASLDFQGLPIVQGYITATVHSGNRHFRLVMTHLESPVPGVPEAIDVQVAQTTELIDGLSRLPKPVVLCGDFNSDANFGDFVDATPSVALLEAAGYEDLWKVVHPADPGNTWPFYLEDQEPPNFYAPFQPIERVDLLLGEGVTVSDIEQVVAPTGSLPSYASDHAGVLAIIKPQESGMGD